MDSTDHQLLSLLRKDARSSVATLASKLGVSRGTVTNRVTKLEDAGIIVGYTVRLRPDAEPTEISAWRTLYESLYCRKRAFCLSASVFLSEA